MITDSTRAVQAMPHLLATPVGHETLVYDPGAARVHRLNPPASAVFGACDGLTPPEAMAARAFPDLPAEMGRDAVAAGLRRLKSAGLVGGLPKDLPRVSRRSFLARWGKAAAVALPVVASLLVPRPAWAALSIDQSCEDCGGNASSCAACTDGVCERCQNPGSCATCVCMRVRFKDGTSCSNDSPLFLVPSCVDLALTAPSPAINEDCAVARANAGAVSWRLCGGQNQSNGGPVYLCCSNCT